MKEITTLEKIAVQIARINDNRDWDDVEEVQELNNLIELARNEGYTDKQIETAKKRSRLYETHWID